MMKGKKIILLATTMLLFVSLFAACRSDENMMDTDKYLELAQEFIDNGEYGAAISILEQGYETTGDVSFLEMIDAIKANSGSDECDVTGNIESNENAQNSMDVENATTEAIQEDNLDMYDGMWAEENIGWVDGGLVLKITVGRETISIDVRHTQSAPASRMAMMTIEVLKSEIVDNTFTVQFDDDSWGNSGTLVVDFEDSAIRCEIKDTHYVGEEGEPMWGVPEGRFLLTRNDQALEALEYTMEEYYELFPEDDPDNWDDEYQEDWTDDTPVYDMTKASGILAQAGLTEQQFRDLCQPLEQRTYVSSYGSITGPTVGRLDRYHVAYGVQYYADNPDDKDIQYATNTWNRICEDYEAGTNKCTGSYGYGNYSTYHLFTKYQDFDTFMLHYLYAPKGESVLVDNTLALLNQMIEYPNDYVGMPYVFLDFDIDTINGTTYTDDHYSSIEVDVVDLRDDIHSPNIIKGNPYYFYVIFEGTYTDYSGDIVLVFSLLSLEKCE